MSDSTSLVLPESDLCPSHSAPPRPHTPHGLCVLTEARSELSLHTGTRRAWTPDPEDSRARRSVTPGVPPRPTPCDPSVGRELRSTPTSDKMHLK